MRERERRKSNEGERKSFEGTASWAIPPNKNSLLFEGHIINGVECQCEQCVAGCRTHHLLQGGAASEGAGEQREAVDEGGEEVARQRREHAPGEHGDHVGDDVGDAHCFRVLHLNPALKTHT